MTNGPGETLLTGTTAEKVKAAALAAVPGGTIIRVETDSEGSPYEAHVTKTDGTQVTVKTNNLTVDDSGETLTGSDIILVANRNLTLAPGAGEIPRTPGRI